MTQNKTTNLIAKLLLKLKTQNEIETVLSELLSRSEVRQINDRIKILEMITAGIPHRHISTELKVGIGTVSRGSALLESKKCIVPNLLKRISKKSSFFSWRKPYISNS